jgi:hypothetical protein
MNVSGSTIYGADNIKDYRTAYNEGRVLNYNKDGQLDAGELPEIMIGSKGTNYPNYGKLTTEEKKLLNNKGNSPIKRAIEAKALYGESLTADQIKGVTQGLIYNPLIGGAQAPQSAMVEGIEVLRGKPYDFRNILFPSTQRIPSETWGVENPVGAFAVDVLADPQLIGGLVRGIGKSGAKQIGKYLTKETALRNAHNYNPFAGKLDRYNRIVGQDGIDDFIESGLVRTPQNLDKRASGSVNLSRKGTTPYPSFGEGVPNISENTYAQKIINSGQKPYIISTNSPMGVSTLGRHGKGSTLFPIDESGKYLENFPSNNASIFEANPHWLRGYKPVEVPKQLPGSPNRGFKSEIDWSKWNKEIPKNKALMDEYLAIEKKAKADGTWMKDARGNPARLPDGRLANEMQWVQAQSKQWEKAYGSKGFDNVGEMSRGYSMDITQNAAKNYPEGRSIFGGDYSTGMHYSPEKQLVTANTEQKGIFNLIYPKNSKGLKIDGKGNSWTGIEVDPKLGIENRWIGAKGAYRQNSLGEQLVRTDDIAYHLEKNNLPYARIENVLDGYPAEHVTVVNNKPGNYLKSLWGNNGMFDMTNPNIYKSIVGGAAIGSQLSDKRKKGWLDNL